LKVQIGFFCKIHCFKQYKNSEDFGTIITQRRFDIQLAGAIKIQLKRGATKPALALLSGFIFARNKGATDPVKRQNRSGI
jgi:hypothetical protein